MALSSQERIEKSLANLSSINFTKKYPNFPFYQSFSLLTRSFHQRFLFNKVFPFNKVFSSKIPFYQSLIPSSTPLGSQPLSFNKIRQSASLCRQDSQFLTNLVPSQFLSNLFLFSWRSSRLLFYRFHQICHAKLSLICDIMGILIVLATIR